MSESVQDSEDSLSSGTECNGCGEEKLNVRPVATTAGRVEVLCDPCHVEADAEGRIDWERDAEVFDYAE